jgi:hypothetical protein
MRGITDDLTSSGKFAATPENSVVMSMGEAGSFRDVELLLEERTWPTRRQLATRRRARQRHAPEALYCGPAHRRPGIQIESKLGGLLPR